jgi:HSP20 family protein
MNEQTTLPARTRGDAPLPSVFGRLRDEIDQLFDDFGSAPAMRGLFSLPAFVRHSPPVDLVERKDRYELAMDLPGMEEKDINVECADGMLVISGEKAENHEEKSDGCLISERTFGSFRRQMALPSDIDVGKIDAKYRRGVLKLTLPKDAKAAKRVRKIAIG